jgi:hypothetical protein
VDQYHEVTIDARAKQRLRPDGARTRFRVGAALVAAAGGVLLGSTFLPWISFFGGRVDGRSGEHSYTGWQLLADCTVRKFPGQCVLAEQGPNPDFIDDPIAAGDWALVAGTLLLAVGLVLVLSRGRGRLLTAVIGSAWVISLAALGGSIAMLFLLLNQPNGGLGGPSVEVGMMIAAVSPVIALTGLGLVQAARAWVRAADNHDWIHPWYRDRPDEVVALWARR